MVSDITDIEKKITLLEKPVPIEPYPYLFGGRNVQLFIQPKAEVDEVNFTAPAEKGM